MQPKLSIHWRKLQQGITLIEALIALLILALGVLGLAAVQARMLVETRTTNSRASAIRLIADLGERIRMNAAGAQPLEGGTSRYADSQDGGFQVPVDTPESDCSDTTTSCTPEAQAAYDRWFWQTEVQQQLPGGLSSITQVSAQQLQIVVAWRLNENTNTALKGTTGTAARQLSDPLKITGVDQGNLCNPGDTNTDNDKYICHVDFIEIPAVN
jgi:type IV pilus assembly protein PilV